MMQAVAVHQSVPMQRGISMDCAFKEKIVALAFVLTIVAVEAYRHAFLGHDAFGV